jgi:cystathionine beta-lyase/cystathionine gamma-synthase
MSGFGGMVSVDVGTREKADQIVTRLKVFTLAESLGGVESLVCHPATMTHASVPAEKRARIGIGDGLVRFSVGVEDSQDLLADLETAFKGV